MAVRTHTVSYKRREPLQVDIYESAYRFFEPGAAVRVKRNAEVARKVLRKLANGGVASAELAAKVKGAVDRATKKSANGASMAPDMDQATVQESETDVYVQQTFHDAPIIPVPRDANVMPGYRPPGFNDPIRDFDELPMAQPDLNRTAVQVVVDDLPAPLIPETDVPMDALHATPLAESGPRAFSELDSIPPPAYDVVGVPQGVVPVIEDPAKDPAYRELDGKMRPRMLIHYERIGLPYKLGEGQRHAGEVRNPRIDDGSVIEAEDWMASDALGFPLSPFSTYLDAVPNVLPANMGMSGIDWSQIGLSLEQAILGYGKDAALSLKKDIDNLEAEIGRLSPSRLQKVQQSQAVVRATTFNLWPSVEKAESINVATHGTWFAAAQEYRKELEDALEKAREEAGVSGQSIVPAAGGGVPGEPRDFVETAKKYGPPVALGIGALIVGALVWRGMRR